MIAEADGAPAGAAWLRFLPAADPGYGFVAPDVPELTIGVARDWRGRGVGRALDSSNEYPDTMIKDLAPGDQGFGAGPALASIYRYSIDSHRSSI